VNTPTGKVNKLIDRTEVSNLLDFENKVCPAVYFNWRATNVKGGEQMRGVCLLC
jgi:hypothetical protein